MLLWRKIVCRFQTQWADALNFGPKLLNWAWEISHLKDTQKYNSKYGAAFLCNHKAYCIFNSCSKIKFVPQLINLNSEFSSATWSMTALSTGTDDNFAKSDVTPEDASEDTEEKQIDDLLMQMKKCKSSICFSPVLLESFSGGTKMMTV